MAFFAVVFVTPNSEAWIPDYISAVTPLVTKHGGKYLARTSSHERLEGMSPNPGLIAIIEFPSKQGAEAFYNDPEYQPLLEARMAGAANELFLVEGKDDFAPSKLAAVSN
jgi:uncharacterized protein (DUF1330 family)